MAGHDAVGAITNAISDPTRFSNPTAEQFSGPEASISDMARGMLDTITDLQSGFQQDVVPSASESQKVSDLEATEATNASGTDQVSDAARILADQIEQSTAVQQQLTRFVMASSVSSSLGRNLNMFLRGQ